MTKPTNAIYFMHEAFYPIPSEQTFKDSQNNSYQD